MRSSELSLFEAPVLDAPVPGSASSVSVSGAGVGELRLRGYQRRALDDVGVGWSESSTQVLSSPTGSGKTEMACSLMRDVVDAGGTAWFVAHLVTLTGQTLGRFERYGLSVGLVQSSNSRDVGRRVLVCSGQTLKARDFARIGRDLACGSACESGCDGKVCDTLYGEVFDLSVARLPDMLVVDECHHAHRYTRRLARAVVQAGGRVLGLTATPYADFMSKSYGRLVVGDTTRRLIETDMLVRYRYFEAVPLYDMSSGRGGGEIRPAGRLRRGEEADYTSRQLESAVRRDVYGDLPAEWLSATSSHFGGPVKTLIAAPTIRIAEGLCEAFESHMSSVDDVRYRGLRFEACSAKDGVDDRPETADVLGRFDSGETMGLASVAKLAIGFDRPEASCLVLARPFATLTPYVQWVGRVLRPWPGKDVALVLDHAGNMRRLGVQLKRHIDVGPERFERPAEPRPQESMSACVGCGQLFAGRSGLCPVCRLTLSPELVRGLSVGLGRLVEVDFGFRDKLYVLADENVERLWYDVSCEALRLSDGSSERAGELADRFYSLLRTPVSHYACLLARTGHCLSHVDALRCRPDSPGLRHVGAARSLGVHPSASVRRASDDVLDVYRMRYGAMRELSARLVADRPLPTTFLCAGCRRYASLVDAYGGSTPLVCSSCGGGGGSGSCSSSGLPASSSSTSSSVREVVGHGC